MYKGGKMSIIISLRLDEEIANQLEDIAKTTDRSKSHLIQEAIEQYVAEYADYQIALDRLNDLHDEIISSKEMRESLANEG
jgi:RHH-type rel operon transcriptional repressor/antitoxin RelB